MSVANASPGSGRALDIGAGRAHARFFSLHWGWMCWRWTRARWGCRRPSAARKSEGLALRTRAVDLRDFDAAPGSLDVVRLDLRAPADGAAAGGAAGSRG